MEARISSNKFIWEKIMFLSIVFYLADQNTNEKVHDRMWILMIQKSVL